MFCLECSCGVLARSFRGVLSSNSNFLRCFGTEFLTLFDFFHGSVSNTVPVHVLVEKKTWTLENDVFYAFLGDGYNSFMAKLSVTWASHLTGYLPVINRR